MNILTLKDVSKIYGELKALDNINLTVEKGEWLAIMGPSGSGKTTMMNIIGCMDKASIGEVILDETNISKLSPKELTEIRRDKIGLIFQQFHLVNYLTAVENIMMAQYYHSMPDEEEAMEALEAVGLADRAKHLPNQLSGGEQQRVCIARALINHPSILLADEPTGNLDEKNEYIVMDIFEKSGMVSYIGKVNMDRNGSENLQEESANQSARDTIRWIEAVQDRYERTFPIITPRFTPSCSDDLMRQLSIIRKKYNVKVYRPEIITDCNCSRRDYMGRQWFLYHQRSRTWRRATFRTIPFYSTTWLKLETDFY